MAEFATSRHGLVARSQAASFGFTPRDIRLAKERGWLTEPVRGVLVLSGYPPTWQQRLAIVTATSASRPLVSDGWPTLGPDEAGGFVARVDLGIAAVRLGLEGHSRKFHFGPIREAADEDRDLRASACGWELIYLGWYAQRSPAAVVEIVAKICRARRDARSA